MGKIFPTEIRDVFEMTPAGTLLMQVVQAEEAWVGKEGEQVYGIVITHHVVEPASHAGVEHRETFFLGVNESAKQVQQGKLKADPEANNPETLQLRSGGLKKYLAKYGIELEGADIEVVLQTIEGKQIIGKVIHVTGKTLKDDGTPMMNARVERWFAPGEVETGIAEVAPAQAVAAPAAARPAAVAGPRPAAPAQAAAATTQAPPQRPALRRLAK